MDDPMDTPPTDHGSDRYDYVELQSPQGMRPIGQWWDDLIAVPCLDCRANVFAAWVGPDPEEVWDMDDPVTAMSDRDNWHISIAHDDSCPLVNGGT